jgi:hypothetical protein
MQEKPFDDFHQCFGPDRIRHFLASQIRVHDIIGNSERMRLYGFPEIRTCDIRIQK